LVLQKGKAEGATAKGPPAGPKRLGGSSTSLDKTPKKKTLENRGGRGG